jgi:hypothetical protein
LAQASKTVRCGGISEAIDTLIIFGKTAKIVRIPIADTLTILSQIFTILIFDKNLRKIYNFLPHLDYTRHPTM